MEKSIVKVHLDSDTNHLKKFAQRHQDSIPVEDVPSVQKECRNNQVEHVDVDVFSPRSDAPRDTIRIELLLKLFGSFRHYLRDECSVYWTVDGIKNAKEIRRWLDETNKKEVSVALCSRYARRLLDGDVLRDLEENNIYWNYKRRANNYGHVPVEERIAIASELIQEVFNDKFLLRALGDDDTDERVDDEIALKFEKSSANEVRRLHMAKIKKEREIHELKEKVVELKAKNEALMSQAKIQLEQSHKLKSILKAFKGLTAIQVLIIGSLLALITTCYPELMDNMVNFISSKLYGPVGFISASLSIVVALYAGYSKIRKKTS